MPIPQNDSDEKNALTCIMAEKCENAIILNVNISKTAMKFLYFNKNHPTLIIFVGSVKE